jgi:hypothetical protein
MTPVNQFACTELSSDHAHVLLNLKSRYEMMTKTAGLNLNTNRVICCGKNQKVKCAGINSPELINGTPADDTRDILCRASSADKPNMDMSTSSQILNPQCSTVQKGNEARRPRDTIA